MSGFDLPAPLAGRAAEGGLAHAYILAGPAEMAELCGRRMAQAMVCTAPRGKPCGVCRGCGKAERGHHPDIISISPEPGKELTVGQVRQMRADAYVLPNEASRKVYLIQDAQRMNPSAQNALLKVLEEGPDYAAFLLLCPNPAALLPTVRSRCEVVQLAGPDQTDAAVARRGDELAGLLLGGDRWAIIAWCVPYEKAKREEVLPVLERARGSLLTFRNSKNTPRAVALAQGLGEILKAGARNLGVGAIWGWVMAL